MNEATAASAVFAALADPTRRQIIEMLTSGGAGTATGLAGDLAISRQAVAKHLQLLQDAGLARSERIGRETRFESQPQALAEVTNWVASVENDWTTRLGLLQSALDDLVDPD